MGDAVYGTEMKICIIKTHYIVFVFMVVLFHPFTNMFLNYIEILDILLDRDKP